MASNIEKVMMVLPLALLLAFPAVAQQTETPSAAKPADPCPVPAAALAQTPDDLAKVQFDIDRFTLCVERAQLLKRLNDLALENQEAVLGLSGSNPGFNLDKGKAPESLPAFEEQKAQVSASAVQSVPVYEQAPAETYEEDWMILSVFGSGADLRAKLSRSDGSVAQVRVGDKLPDGGTVSLITTTQVSVQKDGETTDLMWVEQDL